MPSRPHSPPSPPRRKKTPSQFGTDLSNTFSSIKKKGQPHPALIKGVIGPTDISGTHHGKLRNNGDVLCPCCRRYVPIRSNTNSASGHDVSCTEPQKQGYENEEMKQKHVIVKGWLHKKGSGRDILGTTSWKPRWVELVLVEMKGHSVDVPVLQIYWHPSMPVPSSTISLESSVVMPIDAGDSEWNSFRFDIVQTKTRGQSLDDVKPKTRSFTAPRAQRNQWIYVLNFTLFDYEKRAAKHRSEMAFLQSRLASRPQLPPSPRRAGRSMSPVGRRSLSPSQRAGFDSRPNSFSNTAAY